MIPQLSRNSHAQTTMGKQKLTYTVIRLSLVQHAIHTYAVVEEQGMLGEPNLQMLSAVTLVPTLSATLELMSIQVSAVFNQKTPTVRFSLLTKS